MSMNEKVQVEIARRRLHRCGLRQGGGALVDDDAYVDGVAEDLTERLGDLAREPLLDPVAGELTGHADHKSAVF